VRTVSASGQPGQPCGETAPPFRRGLRGLAAAAGLFVACRALGHAAPPAGEAEFRPPPLCDAWHRGSGEGQPIDVEQIRPGYLRMKERLSGSLRRGIDRDARRGEGQGYDLGLPACIRPAQRRFRPSREIPSELRGKSLWLFRLEEGKEVRAPELVSADPSVLAFLVQTPGLRALESVSRSLGRPVSLAPRGLAEALGVRCAPALVSISKEGEVEIRENP